jgi:hypothetical protein
MINSFRMRHCEEICMDISPLRVERAIETVVCGGWALMLLGGCPIIR